MSLKCMRWKMGGLACVLFFSASVLLCAAGEPVQVITTINKRAITMDEDLRLTIKIVGPAGNLDRPRLSEFPGFTSYYSGRSFSFTFIGGQSQSTTEFNYTLVPKAPGKYTLGPIEVQAGGTLYRADPIVVEVTGFGGQASSSTGAALPPGSFTTQQPVSQAPVAVSPPVQARNFIPQGADPDIFLKTFLDKTDVYPNEQIVLTYSLYTRVPAEIGYFVELPTVTGFLVEDIPPDRKLSPTRVTVGGRTYQRADIKKVVLFATTPGPAQIKPGAVRCDIKRELPRSGTLDDFFDDDFFGGSVFQRRENRTLEGQIMPISVRAFPKDGQPDHFTGAVGRYTMGASIDNKTVKQNEPVTLTVVIEGEGNIDMIERPWIPDLENFRVYDSDTSTEINRMRLPLGGKKTFKILFMPQNQGEQTIPSLQFSYFDPHKRQYATLKTPSFPVNVKPGDATPPTQPQRAVRPEQKQEVQLEKRDIRYIAEDLESPVRISSLRFVRQMLAGLAAVLFLSWVVIFLRRRQQMALDQNLPRKRSQQAKRQLRKKLKVIELLSRSDVKEQQERFFEEADHALTQYISDRLNLASPQGITVEEILEGLQRYGVSSDLVTAVREFYETSDQVRFAFSESTIIQRRKMIDIIKQVLCVLERGPSVKSSAGSGKMQMVGWVLIAGTLLVNHVGPSFAADSTSGVFQKANALYRDGKYQEAISLYEQSPLFRNFSSSELFYNLANSYFKSGRLGKAILNYERALQLDPRNKDIRHNLDYARSLLEYKVEDKSNWYVRSLRQVLSYFTWDEMVLVTLLAALVLLAFGFAKLAWSENRWINWNIRFWLTVSVILLLPTLAKGWFVHVEHPAVITATATTVHFGPAESEKVAFRLTEGLKVNVTDTSQNWCEISLPNNQEGWILKSNLEELRSLAS